MDYIKSKPTITVKISDIKLKIVRFGETSEMNLWADGMELNSSVHTHMSYEVIFVTCGTLDVVTHDKKTSFGKGIVIIPPSLSHYTIPKQKGCFCVLFRIEKSKKSNYVEDYLNDYLSKDISFFEISDDVNYYIHAFARKSNENTVSAEKDAALLAELIFREIISFISSIDILDDRKQESMCIGAIESYINSHIQEKITLSDVAKYVYMSNKQVSRIIMREYGKPLSKLVVEKKLHIARMLLKNTDLKINEVSARINIGTENYFYTMFKKYYGLSPMEYRKKSKEKIDEK